MNTNMLGDFDPESQELLQGIDFLDLSQIGLEGKQKGFQDPLASVRATISFEEIPNEHALNTPFGKDSLFYTVKTGDFFEGNVDFKKVLQKIGAVISDYDNEEIPTGNQLKEVIIEAEIVKKPFNYLEYSNGDSTVINYWQHQKNDFSGQAILNKKIGYLDTEKIFLSRDSSGAQRYLLYIPYANDGNVSLNNPNIEYLEKNAGVKLKYLGIDGLITIFSFFTESKRKTYFEKIYKDIAREIEKSILTDPFALSIISEFPLDLLKYFKSATVEKILFTILRDIVNNDKEKVLLKLFKVLYLNNDFNPDLFLNKLLTIKIGKQSAFVTLYEKMNDWGGENNFSKVIIELTKIWLLSSYSDSNNKIYAKYAPAPNLVYDQKIILGFRKDDFSFTFEENNDIMIVESEFWGLEIPGLNTFNRHNPLQPMTVIDLKEKNNEDLVLEEGVPIPLFYLKAFDDKGAWENFEKATWLILDIVSTFTGVGNLTKLKYLVKGSKLFYLKTVFGIIQVLSSVASIGLALIENSKNKELVNKIRSYLFWVEICTLGADVLSTKILTQKAGEARTVLAEYRQTVKNKKKLEEIDEFAEHLDEIIEVGEEIGLINRISKTFKGLKYEVLVYSDKIVWKVNDKKFNWDNHARLWGGELEFDLNTYGIKGLGQKWTDEAFEIYAERIKTIKVEWKQLPDYPNGEALGYGQFYKVFDETYDKFEAVKSTTFYKTMSKKGFSNIKNVFPEQESIIVTLTN